MKVLIGGVERILPVVAGVVENDVEEDAHIAFVGRRDQVDKVLLCPEAWIDVHVVLNRVAMIVPGSGRGSAIVLENRRQPDGGAAQPLDVVQVIRDSAYFAATELTKLHRRAATGCSTGAARSPAHRGVIETIDQQEINKFLSPLALRVEVLAASRDRKIKVENRIAHQRPPTGDNKRVKPESAFGRIPA